MPGKTDKSNQNKSDAITKPKNLLKKGENETLSNRTRNCGHFVKTDEIFDLSSRYVT